MRHTLLFFLCMALFFPVTTATGKNFAPTPLILSAYSYLWINSGDTEVTIPFTVSGVSATVVFLVYSKDQGVSLRNRTSGYLGWHFVNRIDTCIYVSSPMQCDIGKHSFEWDFRDFTGERVPAQPYTYYFWGYDNSPHGVKAVNCIAPRRFSGASILTRNNDGNLLANPLLFDALPTPSSSIDKSQIVRNKWCIGGDPEDYALIESTTYSITGEAPRIAMDPREFWSFYTLSAETDAVVLRKMGWVPNGEAIVKSDWGNNGEVTYPSTQHPNILPYGGPVSDGGEMIYFPYVWPSGSEYSIPNIDSGIACVDIQTGALLGKIDLSQWWSSPPDAVYRPDFVEYRDGMLFAASPLSCLVQMMDPNAADETWTHRWINGLGDGIWDKNIDADSPQRTWACFGSDAPPIPANISPDVNLFSFFPATGLAPASFGLLGPDGTGIGYFPFPDFAESSAYGVHCIDYGSAFDGMYYSGSGVNTDSTGVWYRAFDCVKGTLDGEFEGPGEGMADLLEPLNGERLQSGQKFTITWTPRRLHMIRIELSTDRGLTWSAVADSSDGHSGMYLWNVPEVNSSQCIIRISSVWDPSNFDMSDIFTITGPTVVDDSTILRFLTVTNTPNPFNPSTTISFTLPQSGLVSLTVYDITGRKVAELARGFRSAGRHTLVWDASGCASGVYFCTLKAGNEVETRKMLLVR